MITKIKSASDAMAALEENFEMLVEKKRTPPIAKEVNNTIGKMTNLVKTNLMHSMWIGNKERITWLDSPKLLENSGG
jgi:hypothetical protein